MLCMSLTKIIIFSVLYPLAPRFQPAWLPVGLSHILGLPTLFYIMMLATHFGEEPFLSDDRACYLVLFCRISDFTAFFSPQKANLFRIHFLLLREGNINTVALWLMVFISENCFKYSCCKLFLPWSHKTPGLLNQTLVWWYSFLRGSRAFIWARWPWHRR